MKTEQKTVIVFTCEICGTEYPNDRKAAEKCEARKTETKLFAVGDVVTPTKTLVDPHKGNYQLVGYVVKILVEPPDVEYIRKHLGNQQRVNMHNLIYLVNTDRKASKGQRYYAAELDYTFSKVGKHFLNQTAKA